MVKYLIIYAVLGLATMDLVADADVQPAAEVSYKTYFDDVPRSRTERGRNRYHYDHTQYPKQLKEEKRKKYSVMTLVALAVFMLIGLALAVNERMKRRYRKIAIAIKTAYSLQNKHIQKHTEHAIRKRDPAFSKSVLTERIWQAFKQVQVAWVNQELAPIRHFVSDGIYESMRRKLEMRAASGVRNEKKSIDIRNVRVSSMVSDDVFDTIYFQITAQAIDYFVKSDSGEIVYAKDHPGVFTEYWVFMRRTDSQTRKKPGLIEGYCPVCDTKLPATCGSLCQRCNTTVNTGQYDWVLTDIWHSSEGGIKHRADIDNLDKMVSKDPLFSVQLVEDRVMAVFYNYIAAMFFAEDKYLTNFATDKFIENQQECFTPQANGEHCFYADVGINTVSVTGIELAEEDDGNDRISVKVKWSGHPECHKVPGYFKPAFERSAYYIQEVILVRQSTGKTSSVNLLNSMHCSNCGTGNLDFIETCGQCDNRLQNIKQGWLLDEIHDLTNLFEHENPERVVRTNLVDGAANNHLFLPVFDAEVLFMTVAGFMIGSGITRDDFELLKRFARINKISLRRIESILKTVGNGVAQTDMKNDVQGQKVIQLLRLLIHMCLIDGKIAPIEKEILEKFAATMRHFTWDAHVMINQETALIYKKAKQLLKELR